jgi:hypothetical protein
VRTILMIVGLIAILLSGAGCAGPSTPFGASLALSVGAPPEPLELTMEPLSLGRGLASVSDPVDLRWHIEPDRPVLHASYNLKVELYDPRGIPDDYKFRVLYNRYDLSTTFRLHAETQLSHDRKVLYITYRDLTLPPAQSHDIVWGYQRDSDDRMRWMEYKQPECELRTGRSPASLEPFTPSQDLVEAVQSASELYGYNPSFLMALVGQESGFDPWAVSSSRAVGLAQITPLAAEEISPFFPDWPFDKNALPKSSRELRQKILNGQWSAKQDWRLDPEKNILGSAQYLEVLKDYWRRPAHVELLKRHDLKGSAEMTRLLLASYNSGPYRVKTALQKHGAGFLWQSNELREARTYVQKIKSYCYHFQKRSIEE